MATAPQQVWLLPPALLGVVLGAAVQVQQPVLWQWQVYALVLCLSTLATLRVFGRSGRRLLEDVGDPVVVPIPDDFDGTMDEWLVSVRGDEPRTLPRSTAALLDEARSEAT